MPEYCACGVTGARCFCLRLPISGKAALKLGPQTCVGEIVDLVACFVQLNQDLWSTVDHLGAGMRTHVNKKKADFGNGPDTNKADLFNRKESHLREQVESAFVWLSSRYDLTVCRNTNYAASATGQQWQ